jgi:rhamnogalacturonan endolyase
MHDHTYRMAVCWQNTAYNQPPHLGYNLAEAMQPRLLNPEREMTLALGEEMTFESGTRYVKTLSVSGSILPDGTKKFYSLPDGFESAIDNDKMTIAIKGVPQESGDYRIIIKMTGRNAEVVEDTLTVHVTGTEGIMDTAADTHDGKERVYDMSGRLVTEKEGNLPKGVYLVQKGGKVRKIYK